MLGAPFSQFFKKGKMQDIVFFFQKRFIYIFIINENCNIGWSFDLFIFHHVSLL